MDVADGNVLSRRGSSTPPATAGKLHMLQTALHWGAKHGNENIVKLIAGTYKDYIKSVNETTVSIISLRLMDKIFVHKINIWTL
ncbi:hypothetical protein ALC53_10397 [Atta colombica]|uniref:Uncharacterized protein n=1 Tax=Atta colombica TaxID=520822 RepID=A0A195B420_9HYME|nr:hypothetical protein ALC53_10397 [Atta colombica]